MNRNMWVLPATVLTMALSACVVAPHRGAYIPPITVVAPMAPPPMRVEVISNSPGPGFLWVAGFWRWDGRQHQWEQGRWEQKRERERWVPHHWAPDGRGQRQSHDGRWRRE